VTIRGALVFDAIICTITMVTAAGTVFHQRKHRARWAAPPDVCGFHGDDGLTLCSTCGRVGPHNGFTPHQRMERIGILHLVSVTYYHCKGGCHVQDDGTQPDPPAWR
jgi:hypothetical protein